MVFAVALALALALALVPAAEAALRGAAASAGGASARALRRNGPSPFPAHIALPEHGARGQRAVDLLGARLAEVATWYGKTPAQLKSLLTRDSSYRVDATGRLFVEEPGPGPAAKRPSPPANSSHPRLLDIVDGTLEDVALTFTLHSRPGALRTLYLDFDGAVLTNKVWNVVTGGTPTITALGMDVLDGVSGWSTSELRLVQGIWQQVAEDFAPFDLDVTTEAPAPGTLSRTSTSDMVFGTTAVITKKPGVYVCTGCAGVAYLGAFDTVDSTGTDWYKPALVFYDELGPGVEKWIAEAISHEVGHNGGLHHDGAITSDPAGIGYYPGHGSGPTGWAPIMGVGYGQALVQWSKGEYANANNPEDDFAVLQSFGMALRVDDHGNTTATATRLSGGTTSPTTGVTTLTLRGVIHSVADVDVVSFPSMPGTVTASVAVAGRSANLDAVLTLVNPAGAVLVAANPPDALDASLTYTVSIPGVYYLTVRGTGKGDPLGTGYTAYSSLGYYGLTVTCSQGAAPTSVLSATSATSGPAPLTVSFSAVGSTDPDGAIATYTWSFGDGSTPGTGVVATASHVFPALGTFVVTVRATDNAGLSTLSAPLSVTTTGTPPTAAIAATPRSGSTPLTVSFSAAASTDVEGADTLVSFLWTFGDGSTGTGVTASHVFTALGTYLATVRVTDNTGLSSTSAAVTITASGLPPTAVIAVTGPVSGRVPLSVTFSAAGSADPDGTIATYAWTFGDGGVGASGVSATRVFAMVGTYTVTVRVTDNTGLSTTSAPVTVTATGVAPVAVAIAGAVSGYPSTTIGFSAAGSSDQDGTITAYAWVFGDGNTATGVTTSHVFTAVGVYTVTVRVTDNSGLSSTSPGVVITISPRPPSVVVSATQLTGVAPFLASLSAAGSASNVPGSTIASYAWTFGDGSTGSGVAPTHLYTTVGSWWVTVTVTDSGGLSASRSLSLSSTGVAPTAVINATSPTTGPSPLTVAFTAANSVDPDGTIVTYLWGFGDGASGTGVAPSHLFVGVGTYSVVVMVTDNTGQSRWSASVFVTVVNTPPTAVLSATALEGVAPWTAALSAAGSTDADGRIVSYTWEWGDGTPGLLTIAPSTSHVYRTAGAYTVKVKTTDDLGAQTMSTGLVVTTRPAAPVAVASSDGATGNIPFAVWLHSLSYDPDGTIATTEWSFGDGSTGTGANLIHTFTTVGAFSVTVRVTDNTGLSSTSLPLTITTTAGSPPIVVATVSGVSSALGTVPFSVYFSAWGSYDSDPGGSVAGATWDFGDGSTGSGMTIVHEYKVVGVYTATARAIDNTGLASSPSAGLTVSVVASSLYAHLDRMTMALGVTGAGAKRAAVGTVTVRVVNGYGTPLVGATVSGSWSGVVTSGVVKANTNAAGTVTFKSASTKTRGSLNFTVTSAEKVGYPYDPAANSVDTSKSASW